MIDVTFEGEETVTIAAISQWSTGQMLKVSGLSLNDKIAVNYSHTAITCDDFSIDRLGKTYDDVSVIPIPNRLFTEPGTITVSFADYTIIVPVSAADKPDDYESTYRCDTDTDSCMISELQRSKADKSQSGDDWTLTGTTLYSGSSTTTEITLANGCDYTFFVVDCKVRSTDTGHLTGIVPMMLLPTSSTGWCFNLADESNYDSRYWYRSGNDVKIKTRARSSSGTYYTVIGYKMERNINA